MTNNDSATQQDSRMDEVQPNSTRKWPTPFAVVFSSFVSLAILNSFIAVSDQNTSEPPNYWQDLKTKKNAKALEIEKDGGALSSQTSHPERIRELAMLSWQDGEIRPASTLIANLWTSDITNDTSKYNRAFVEDCLMLGGLYQAEGTFPSAIRCYQSLFDYESQRLKKNNPAITRDYNNLAVTYYLSGNAATSDRQRKDLFEKSRKLYAIANSTVDRHLASYLVPTLKNNESYLDRDSN